MHRIIFQLGPVTLYSYGLLIAFGFILATLLILRDSSRVGISRDDIFDCLISILVGGLIGGRLLFVLINHEFYLRDPIRIFFLNEGGMAIQGSLFAGALAGVIACRIKKIPFWRGSDLIAPYIALGQAIGRIGCFFNGCCYGVIYNGPFSVTFPAEAVSRVPVQLYSSAVLLIIYFFLILARRNKPFDGYIFSLYLMAYGVFRFLMDFLRDDNPVLFLQMRLSQMISLAVFALGAIMYFALAHYNRKSSCSASESSKSY